MHLASVNWAANWKNFPVDIEEKLVTNNFSSERYKLSSAKHRTASDAFADNIKRWKNIQLFTIDRSNGLKTLYLTKLQNILWILLPWNWTCCSWFKANSAMPSGFCLHSSDTCSRIPYWFWSQMWLMMWFSWHPWSWHWGQPWRSLQPWVAACPCRNDCFCFNIKLKASRFSSVFDHQHAMVITFWSSSSSLLTC